MKFNKQKTALWLAVVVKAGFALYTGGAFANSGEWDKYTDTAVEIAEDVGGSLAYDYDPVDVETFAAWAKISVERAERLREAKPYLFQKNALESEGGFNPFTCAVCDVRTVEELEDGRFSEDQAWKWFKFRGLEIKACYEDEVYNEEMHRCELIDELK